MTEITDKAMYAGVDACDAEIRKRDDWAFETTHLMDEFMKDNLTSINSLEDLIDQYQGIMDEHSTFFGRHPNFGKEEIEGARILARAYLSAVCTVLESRLLIPAVADVAEEAFNKLRSENDEEEVKKFMDTALRLLKRARGFPELRDIVNNFEAKMPETSNEIAGKKALNATVEYYKAACSECGIELAIAANDQ